MAGILEYDLEGWRISAGESGNVWNRTWLARELEAGPSIPALIGEAYALLPNDGAPAPAPIVNMFVRETTIERIWQDVEASPARWFARGVVTYTTPTRAGGVLGTPDDNGPGVLISSTASVEEIETDSDRAGAQIVTTYDNAQMAHRARTFRTGATHTFRRVEVSNPRTRQDAHQGTLNAALWNGYAPETVLCQAINWETDDFGASYLVDYTFAVRPSWTFRAVHEDPFFPGRPLPGASGAAIATVDLIPTSNFDLLNITLPA